MHLNVHSSFIYNSQGIESLSIEIHYYWVDIYTYIRIYVDTHKRNSPVYNIHLKSPPLSENFSALGYKIFFFGLQFSQLKTCKLAGHASRKTLTRLKLRRGWTAGLHKEAQEWTQMHQSAKASGYQCLLRRAMKLWV